MGDTQHRLDYLACSRRLRPTDADMQGTEEGRTGADTRADIKPLIKPVLSKQPMEFQGAFFVSATGQKLRKRKSLVFASTFSRIARSGSSRAISTAPIIVEKIAKKARSFSEVRWPGMNGNIRLL